MEKQLDTIAFRAMNSEMEVIAEAAEERDELELYARQWFEAVEHRFSRFRSGSELSRLNAAAGARCLISQPMLEVLRLGEDYRALTDGAFSLFVHNALHEAGYAESFERLATAAGSAPASVPAAAPAPSPASAPSASLALDPAMRSLRMAPGCRLDVGGIAKGWAARQLAAGLRSQWGMDRGLVNAGGDLEAWGGSSASEPWIVAAAAPWPGAAEAEPRLRLWRGAVATSSVLRRRWSTERGTMHHLIDPRTGRPAASGVVQSTVIGSDLVECEIWAKTMCIVGLEEGLAHLRRKTRGLEALIYTEDGRLHYAGERSADRERWVHLPADHLYKLQEA
ncbi:FAD:protein FMN transferase [Paenibacillus athensensis]|nr:FAD:protein FMN transferase [Paenibacillus athensensis]MCD1258870.1 FAD:protein FMN transferase [Paenibacillus athensensis]